MTALQGGKFWSGFAAGSVSSVMSSLWQGGTSEWQNPFTGENHTYTAFKGIGGTWANSTTGTMFFGSMSGGAAAALTGGNFWQGAVSGMIVSGLNHTLHNPKPKKLNAVQKYFDYNDDGKISNFEIGLGVVDLGVTIFDIVSIPSGEGVATHLALKQSAKSLTTKTVVKTSTKLIDDTAKQAKNWLGSGYKTVTNKAGDNIFMSKDGLRKIRFDIKNSHGDKPHIHLEEFVNGKWRDAIKGTHRIYPKK